MLASGQLLARQILNRTALPTIKMGAQDAQSENDEISEKLNSRASKKSIFSSILFGQFDRATSPSTD
jgi:hypothetical protein